VVLLAERVAKGGGKKPVKAKKAAAPKKPATLTANTVKAKKAPAKKKPAATAKAAAE
jgi:DNA topoisomerase-1